MMENLGVKVDVKFVMKGRREEEGKQGRDKHFDHLEQIKKTYEILPHKNKSY